MTDWNLWPNGWSKQKVDKNRPPFLFNLKHGLLLLNFLIWCTIWSKNAIRHQASNLHLVEKITRKFDALERIALCYYQTVPHIKKWKKVEFFQMEKRPKLLLSQAQGTTPLQHQWKRMEYVFCDINNVITRISGRYAPFILAPAEGG